MKLALALAALLGAAAFASAQNSWDPAADSGGSASQQGSDASSDDPQPQAQAPATVGHGEIPHDGPPNSGDAARGDDSDGAGDSSGAAGGGNGGGSAGGSSSSAMSIGDARVNIGSIVQAFVDAHSRDGAWLLRDKKTKAVRRLTLQRVDENSTAPAGDQRYEADATLKDLDTSEILHARFVADFSGPEWKVVGLRLFEPLKTAKKKRGRASASPAS